MIHPSGFTGAGPTLGSMARLAPSVALSAVYTHHVELLSNKEL